jgi:hypothetical protein
MGADGVAAFCRITEQFRVVFAQLFRRRAHQEHRAYWEEQFDAGAFDKLPAQPK